MAQYSTPGGFLFHNYLSPNYPTACPTTLSTTTRSKRCEICRGCQSKPCGTCIYCQDSQAFGGPGIKKQSCLERRCQRVLENRLQKEIVYFKARVGCNKCEECQKPECQECLVCLDIRFFDNRYTAGAMCTRKKCEDARSLPLPSQQQQQPVVNSTPPQTSHRLFSSSAMISRIPNPEAPHPPPKQLQVINIYVQKYPILSKMLKFYSKFAIHQNDLSKKFNWKFYSNLNVIGRETGSKMLQDFPHFTELSNTDKSLLLHRFWRPFWFFERICDTFVTLDDAIGGKFVMLEDKSAHGLNTLINDNKFGNQNELVFKYWNSILKLLHDTQFQFDIMEIMYIFCYILWNYTYLNKNKLSEEGEEIVRRGRLIVNQEMREFYEYDDQKWQRIYLLRNILLLTENIATKFENFSTVE